MARTTTRVEVTGLRELGEAMRELSADVAKRIIFNATLRAAKVTARQASINAPRSERAHRVGKGGPVVQPGNLARGIVTKRLKSSEGVARYEVRWKAKKKGDPFYGLQVEFGNVHMSAQPFVRPAFDATKDKALKEMTDTLARRIAKANQTVK